MKALVCLVSVCGITGCAINSTISNFDEYAVVPMIKSACAPRSTEVSTSKIIVSVARFDDSSLESDASKKLSREANLPTLMSTRVQDFLHEAGMEVYSKQERRGKLHDYVVIGTLDTVDLTTDFKGAHEEKQYKIAGKKQQVGPKCKHKATVKGHIKIYDNTLKLVDNIPIGASQSTSEDTTIEQCSITSKDVPLVRAAAEEAVNEVKTTLQNFHSLAGYVLEKRSNMKDSIYKVSIGKGVGLKPGADVEVWRCYHYTNPLTKKTAMESRLVAKGTVTNEVGSNYSWVKLEEERDLQLGDTVKVTHRGSLLPTQLLQGIKEQLMP